MNDMDEILELERLIQAVAKLKRKRVALPGFIGNPEHLSYSAHHTKAVERRRKRKHGGPK